MKITAIKNNTTEARSYTGKQLAAFAHDGVYVNVDSSYTGLVVVSKNGHLTYFDRSNGSICPFDVETWANARFVHCDNIKKIVLEF